MRYKPVRALTSLKYFAELAPNYHVVVAGSLLDVVLHREKYSFPVGKVRMKTLFPLDFEEFLWAEGQKQATEIIRTCFNSNKTCNLHEHFLEKYRLYLCLGAMQQAVNVYLNTHDFEQVEIVQHAINDAYIADMAKCASPGGTVKIMAVYKNVPAQLAKENKKFQYILIKSGARSMQFETALDWLCAAGIRHKCVKVT